MKRYFTIYTALVLLFIFIFGILTYFWTKNDNSICGVDSQNHLLFSIDFFYNFLDILRAGKFNVWNKMVRVIDLLGTPTESSGGCPNWPNGLNLFAAISYLISGKSLFSAKLALLPYLSVLLISTYLIGKLIYSEISGLTAAFILFMYPMIFESSRQFQLDLPLTAMTALNIFFLLKCENFRQRNFSIFLGFSLGWSMLIKGQVIFFISMPFLLVLYDVFKNMIKQKIKNPLTLKQLQNFAISVVIAVLIASIWWREKIILVYYEFIRQVFDKNKTFESIWSWDQKYSFNSISFYLKEFLGSMGSVFLWAFLLSFLVFLKRRIKYKYILLSWLVVPFILFSLTFTTKHSRYLMPIFPVMAVITAGEICSMANRRIKTLLLSSIIVFGITQYYIFSYVDNSGYRDLSMGPKRQFRIFGQSGYGSDYETFKPHIDDIGIDEVVKIIMNESAPTDRPIKIGSIVCDYGRPGTLETVYWLKIENEFMMPIDLTEMHRSFIKNFNSLDYILFRVNSDRPLEWPSGKDFYKLLKGRHPGKISEFETLFYDEWNKLIKDLETSRPDFYLIGKVFMGHSIYYIYKNTRADKCRKL